MDHISSGHMRGGSRTSPQKTLFPEQMTRDQVEAAVRQAYRYGEPMGRQGERVLMQGPGPGFRIQMRVNTKTKVIETAYPVF